MAAPFPYPRLHNAAPEQRAKWEICGGGYSLHWPELDENINTNGMLQSEPVRRERLLGTP